MCTRPRAFSLLAPRPHAAAPLTAVARRSGSLDLYELVLLLQRAGYHGTSGQYE
eukprot:SAG31_NODE_46754_length_253_cov_0.668831_1_plen_53_part_01